MLTCHLHIFLHEVKLFRSSPIFKIGLFVFLMLSFNFILGTSFLINMCCAIHFKAYEINTEIFK